MWVKAGEVYERSRTARRYRRPAPESASIRPLLRKIAIPEFQCPPLGFLPSTAASSSADSERSRFVASVRRISGAGAGRRSHHSASRSAGVDGAGGTVPAAFRPALVTLTRLLFSST